MTWLFGQTWLWYLLAFVVGVLLAWLLLVLPQRRKLRVLDRDRSGATGHGPAPTGRVAAPAAASTADAPGRAPAVDDAVTEQIQAVDPALSTLDTSARGPGGVAAGAAGLGAAGLGAAALAGGRDGTDDGEVTGEIPRATDTETTQQIPVIPAADDTETRAIDLGKSAETTAVIPVVPDPDADATAVVERPSAVEPTADGPATESGATESGATESGATESGVTESGATGAGATEAGGDDASGAGSAAAAGGAGAAGGAALAGARSDGGTDPADSAAGAVDPGDTAVIDRLAPAEPTDDTPVTGVPVTDPAATEAPVTDPATPAPDGPTAEGSPGVGTAAAAGGAALAAGAVGGAAAGGAAPDDGPFGPGSARPDADGSSPDPAFRIKGDVDTMRYHGSRSPYFDRTPASVWFRTGADAEAAGFVSWDTRGRKPAVQGLVSAPAPAAPEPAPEPAPESAPESAEPTPGRFPGSALPLADGAAPGPEYTVKGNANSMLFHTTASPYYGRTKAEVWFVDAASAEAAGFTEWRKRRLG